MLVRQSDLKTWNQCPLKYRWQKIDGLPRQVSASAVFGSIMHDCVLVLEKTGDLAGAINRFLRLWRTPALWDPIEGQIDYYVRGSSWVKFNEKGPNILRHWWEIIQWETDLVLAREYPFWVPIGDGHTLHGTIDKLVVRWHAATEQWILLISDYKTNNKVPTYEYLEEDLQFSAYGYATTQPEFWANLFPNDPAQGMALYEQYKSLPRHGEWVQLTSWRRMDAGPREERHFNRVTMAVNALAASVEHRIFVPTISGESCRYCEFRGPCGLPELMDDDDDNNGTGAGNGRA